MTCLMFPFAELSWHVGSAEAAACPSNLAPAAVIHAASTAISRPTKIAPLLMLPPLVVSPDRSSRQLDRDERCDRGGRKRRYCRELLHSTSPLGRGFTEPQPSGRAVPVRADPTNHGAGLRRRGALPRP